MYAEIRPDYPSEWSAMRAVATKLGVGHAETVRKAEVDEGPGRGRPRRSRRS